MAYNQQAIFSGYAPVEFEDAEDQRPTAAVFDIGGAGSTTPYTTAMNGIVLKHADEIKQKVAAAIQTPTGWKKRLRSFLNQKNSELLDFLQLSITSHPTLGKGEIILRKFGNLSLRADHPTIRDLVLDVSGNDYISEINALLLSVRKGENPMVDFLASVSTIFDQYREAGEEALKQESILRSKMEIFDKFQGKIGALFDLDPTEQFFPLLQASEEYLGSVFEKNQIKDTYIAFIEAYRKFITLRDIVLMIRSVQSNENEPVCIICIEEPIVYCMSPCGHTYCQSCSQRQMGPCFVCRAPVRDKVKMFFN
uniref:RING-type domain-containing protein n=1 Tax=viral metagenome TaxID=1070528 RepID=A0A6C0JXY1_9ZZZZ